MSRLVAGLAQIPRRARHVALAVCASAGLAVPVRAQVSVDRVDLTLAPGAVDRRTAAFNVMNESPAPMNASVYLADWDRTERGDNRFFDRGTLPRSCGQRLRVFPAVLQLAPGATQSVRITAEGVDTLRAECWAVVFVEARAPRTDSTDRQLSYILRLGVKVYVTPPGLARDGTVEDMQLVAPAAAALADPARSAPADPARTAASRLEIAFRNAGGIHLATTGSVEFRTPDNALAAKTNIAEFPTLPGARRIVSLPLPRLAPGRYVALALLDYGGAEIAAGQLEIEVR